MHRAACCRCVRIWPESFRFIYFWFFDKSFRFLSRSNEMCASGMNWIIIRIDTPCTLQHINEKLTFNENMDQRKTKKKNKNERPKWSESGHFMFYVPRAYVHVKCECDVARQTFVYDDRKRIHRSPFVSVVCLVAEQMYRSASARNQRLFGQQSQSS